MAVLGNLTEDYESPLISHLEPFGSLRVRADLVVRVEIPADDRNVRFPVIRKH